MTSGAPPRIGSYDVDREIGRGGMGVVYLGHDAKLERPIAIKALSAEFAVEPQRLARFEREARVLASLSHGNIATVYGFEEVEEHRYLVMEFVEGETLGDRLAGGPLPVNEALAVCAQIAAGVEAAHEAGVVHRDLKPGNVIVRPDGTAKVLDFGLARELPSRSSVTTVQADKAPPVTQEGASIGTPGYMSPEQVRGMTVDKRTDIFAFGCILYECLAGRLAFPGATATDAIAAILEREPDWSVLPANTPPTVQLLLRRCLQKDRRRRLRDIGDARIELEMAIDDPTATSLGLASAALIAGGTRQRRPALWSVLPWVLTAGLAVGLAALGFSFRSEPGAIRKFSLTIPQEQAIQEGTYETLALSPDGDRLVFVGRGTPWSQLYVRPLNQLEAVPLANTTGAIGPFFSPDGQWLAYATDSKLMKISIRGGPPATLCEASAFRGGTWGPDGTIVLAPRRDGPLVRVLDTGGTPEPLTTIDPEAKGVSHRYPHFLPDGRGVLFTNAKEGSDWEDAAVSLVLIETKEQKELIKGGSFGRYVPTGHLVYHRENTLMAAPFDLDTLEVTGPSVPVLEAVSGGNARSAAQFCLSKDGTLIYLSGSGNHDSSLVWLDRQGNAETLSSLQRKYRAHALSPDPDNSRIAVTVEDDSDEDIWILERERDILRPLTFDPADDRAPIWSPDGDWIVFASDRDDGEHNLYRVRADFTGTPERLTTSPHRHEPQAWSPDGSTVIFMEWHPETNGDLLLLKFDEDGRVAGEPEILTNRPAWEWRASFSPDGRWIMYSSAESGRAEIYVRPATGPGAAVQVSTEGGWLGRWSPIADELVYTSAVSPPVTLWNVSYTTDGDTFKPGLPEELFEFELAHRSLWWIDISADGAHVSVLSRLEDTSDLRHPRIILNWFEELKRKATPGTS